MPGLIVGVGFKATTTTTTTTTVNDQSPSANRPVPRSFTSPQRNSPVSSVPSTVTIDGSRSGPQITPYLSPPIYRPPVDDDRDDCDDDHHNQYHDRVHRDQSASGYHNNSRESNLIVSTKSKDRLKTDNRLNRPKLQPGQAVSTPNLLSDVIQF